jgi:[protein-PII] uridylyltransferase
MQRYLSAREELVRAAVPGIPSARRLARLTDEHLADLAEASASRHLGRRTRWTLIALGGYGSGALLPGSDLDLLVISNASSATLKPFAEDVLYPLWDAGLEVGHQVRSRRDQTRAVREDMKTLTSTLTGRVIAGDQDLGIGVLRDCAAGAGKRVASVMAELHERERPGSPYLLEPDLKEGAGGRRDFDELTWTAAVLTGAPQSDPSALVSLGLLSAEQLARLQSAADVIAAARWELDLMGASQPMTLDVADELETSPQEVQRALEDTYHILAQTRRRVLQRGGIDTGSMSSVEVTALLETGLDGLPALEEAIWAGRLETLVPGLADLMALRRPGVAHQLTVGAHCCYAAALVREISAGHTGGEAVHRSAAEIDDLRPVALTALVHDIGKETPGPGHAERGASTAYSAARAFGLDDAADTMASLVRHHLLLPETASREDLDDEDAVLRVAEELGDRTLVAPLHVLTAADSIATGPTVWTEWHAALIGKLVARLDSALSDDVDGAGIATLAENTRDQALELSNGEDPHVAEFIRAAPMRYLAIREPEDVVADAGLVAEVRRAPAAEAHAVDVRLGPIRDSYRVTIAARDIPGLLATISGALALTGLDILSVEAHRGGPDVALDTFTVRSATRATPGPETWDKLERTLHQALLGSTAIGVRLAERRRDYRQEPRVAPSVDIQTDDAFAAVVAIRTPDRIGLLYDIAHAIELAGLDIVSVTATTRDGEARDVFRVTDLNGQVPRDAGLLGQLKMRLRELG